MNPEAISNVIAADLRGDPINLRKPLYIEQNTFDVSLDTPVFRIFQTQHLRNDVRNKCLTHTSIGPMIWGDPAENPLLGRSYVDDVTGGSLSLRPLVENLFGVCWSLSSVATQEMWSYFSYGSDSVRIQSTPRKLLGGVMDLRNPFYMLHHFVGRIEYVQEAEFDAYFEDADFTKYLDSLGQGIALSVLKLPDGPAAEQEVRLVFHLARDEEWAKKYVEIRDGFVQVPFCWDGVIDGIVPGPRSTSSTFESLKAELRGLDI